MKEEIFESTAKGKVIFCGLIIFALALYVTSDWLASILHPNTTNLTIEQLKELSVRNDRLLVISSPISLVFHLVLAYHIFGLGRRIERSGQFPPPGSNIPFSMKIKRGKSAMSQARAAYFSAVLTIINGLIPLVYVVILRFK